MSWHRVLPDKLIVARLDKVFVHKKRCEIMDLDFKNDS